MEHNKYNPSSKACRDKIQLRIQKREKKKVQKDRVIYPVLDVKQLSVTSISTSEPFCGLYAAHPSCRSAGV